MRRCLAHSKRGLSALFSTGIIHHLGHGWSPDWLECTFVTSTAGPVAAVWDVPDPWPGSVQDPEQGRPAALADGMMVALVAESGSLDRESQYSNRQGRGICQLVIVGQQLGAKVVCQGNVGSVGEGEVVAVPPRVGE